jgi:hypothetical protein
VQSRWQLLGHSFLSAELNWTDTWFLFLVFIIWQADSQVVRCVGVIWQSTLIHISVCGAKATTKPKPTLEKCSAFFGSQPGSWHVSALIFVELKHPVIIAPEMDQLCWILPLVIGQMALLNCSFPCCCIPLLRYSMLHVWCTMHCNYQIIHASFDLHCSVLMHCIYKYFVQKQKCILYFIAVTQYTDSIIVNNWNHSSIIYFYNVFHCF